MMVTQSDVREQRDVESIKGREGAVGGYRRGRVLNYE